MFPCLARFVDPISFHVFLHIEGHEQPQTQWTCMRSCAKGTSRIFWNVQRFWVEVPHLGRLKKGSAGTRSTN